MLYYLFSDHTCISYHTKKGTMVKLQNAGAWVCAVAGVSGMVTEVFRLQNNILGLCP
jgi:uncharacterized metal-binding protein